MMKILNRRWITAFLSVIVILAVAGCGSKPVAPTGEAVVSEATSTSGPVFTPTPRATATPTSMPEMPSGPFQWTGSTRPLLMAHYMPWYQTAAFSGQWGWHWTMNHFSPTQDASGAWKDLASHYTPLTGPYDSGDEAILEYQVELMKLSGVDGVIVDWYGIEDFYDYAAIDQATAKLFQVVKKAGLKFAICYEDATIKIMVDNGHFKKEEAIPHGQKVMRYLQDTWFGDEAYLKDAGRPVLFIFGPQYFKAGEDWEALFSVLDPKPVFVTEDNRTVPQAISSYPWPPMWASQAGILSHDILLNYLTSFYEKAASWDYKVAGAFPGFYDIYKEAGVGNSYGYLDALDGKTFRFTMQEALNYKPDAIQLVTWNDYGEGTNIEPTVEFEYRYLEMVQEARKVTGGGDFTYTTDDLRLPLELYQLRLKHASEDAAKTRFEEAFAAIAAGQLDTVREIIADLR